MYLGARGRSVAGTLIFPLIYLIYMKAHQIETRIISHKLNATDLMTTQAELYLRQVTWRSLKILYMLKYIEP
jgi:hypothetical protein